MISSGGAGAPPAVQGTKTDGYENDSMRHTKIGKAIKEAIEATAGRISAVKAAAKAKAEEKAADSDPIDPIRSDR